MPFRRAFALALLLSPAPLLAQNPYQPVTQSDADALAEQVRRLGANPLDLTALLNAGELSVGLEDLNAAGAFFARAEKIDPRNGRAKAGEAAILVRSERPAEALRYFGYAEGYGWPVARFASDRGLAYDLLGDSGRAQRDYQLALATRDDPETRRRYALSLAIAGRQAQALDQLAPLIRQNNRAAWRSRAFVLAMGGNAGEASRIAQTMMPPGAASGLASFFAELPRLPATDRAFAVHFGEVRPTPQRLADARLAPQQAPLALEPLPMQVAAAPASNKKGKRDRRRDRDRNVEVAALLPVPVASVPSPPAYQAPIYAPYVARTPVRDRPLTAGEQASLAAAGMRNLPGRSSRPSTPTYTAPVPVRTLTPAQQAIAAASGRAPAPVAIASIQPTPVAPLARQPSLLAAATPTPRPGFTAQPVQPSPSTQLASTIGTRTNTAPTTTPPALAAQMVAPPLPRAPVASVTPAPGSGAPVALATPVAAPALSTAAPTVAQAAPGFSSSPVTPPLAAAVTGPPVPTELARVDVPPSSFAVPPVGALEQLPSTSAVTPPATTVVDPTALAVTSTVEPPVAGVQTLESIASIEPSGVNQPAQLTATATPAPSATPIKSLAVSRPPTPRVRPGRGDADSILAKIVAGLTIPAAELDIAPTRATPGEGKQLTLAARRAADRRALADKADVKPADDRKTAAGRKALADRKAAAEKKALADKEAAEAKRIERAQPARIWVQVAGGANEAGLAKAWKATKDKAPGILGARQAFTTPLRATNRVLTGPFKTDAEARAYVNQLARSGVSAFTFTSDKGQKITKLDAK